MSDTLQRWINSLKHTLPKLAGGKSLHIGLDLGPDRLNLVQMKLAAGKPTLNALASLPYPCTREELFGQPKILQSLLKTAFAQQPFKGNQVVSNLPADQVKVMTVSYRCAEGQTPTQAIVAELRERLKGELDNLVVDFLMLRLADPDASQQEALVALAPREHVMKHLNLLTDSGLEVLALDIGPTALARLVVHVGARHTPEFPLLPNALLINFGAESSFLTVIWGRRLMLDRAVEFCENRIFKRLKQVLDMPQELAQRLLYPPLAEPQVTPTAPDESEQMLAEVLHPELNLLLQEVNKTLVYMASRTRGKSVDVIFLTGPLACYGGLVHSLSTQLGVPVRRLNPVLEFAENKPLPAQRALGSLTGMALTTGLALRGVPEIG